MESRFCTICLHRTPVRDDETFSCSYHGQLVTLGCCIECETEKLETLEEKKQRKIKFNERLIVYHQKQIGELRQEIFKLSGNGEAETR